MVFSCEFCKKNLEYLFFIGHLWCLLLYFFNVFLEEFKVLFNFILSEIIRITHGFL